MVSFEVSLLTTDDVVSSWVFDVASPEDALREAQGASGSLSGNSRLYLKSGNASNMTDIVDVGIPPTNASVTNVMLAFDSITADRLKDGNVLLATADFTTGAGDGGAGAAATLKISSEKIIRSYLGHF